MSEKEMRRMARVNQLPRSIVERSVRDPIIHAAIMLYAQDDTITIEEFLERIVLALADANDHTRAAFANYVAQGPAPLVIQYKN